MANRDKPIHQIRVRDIRAAIWLNRSEKTGEPWFSVTVTRSYRVNEMLKDTVSFRRDDLPIVSKVLEMAHTWIWRKSQQLPQTKNKGVITGMIRDILTASHPSRRVPR